MKSRTFIAVVVLVFGLLPSLGAAQEIAFLWTASAGMESIGTLPGYGYSIGYSINKFGEIVGEAIDVQTLNATGFLWLGSAQGLQKVPGLNGMNAIAYGVNDSGSVIGGQRFGNAKNMHAFLWTKDAGLRDLGTLGGVGCMNCGSLAFGISRDGTVVGQSTIITGESHAFSWTETGGMRDLGTLSGAQCSSCTSVALAINSVGDMVGNSCRSVSGVCHAVLWRNGSILDLGTLGGTGCASCYSVAADINDIGQIAGSSYVDESGTYHAFLWTQAIGMQDLGTGNWSDSAALGINDTGQIVGELLGSGFHAFLWTPTGGIQDLGSIGPSNQSIATSINDRGQVTGYTY